MDEGKQFLVRAYHNRLLEWDEDDPETDAEDARALLDYARSLPAATDPRASYPVHVPATKKHAARDAPVVMAWARALGEFGATIMFAGNFAGRTQTLPLVVYGEFQAGDVDASVAAAAILVLAAFGVLVAVRALRWGRALDLRGT